tara:strand:+ start:2221 stop:2703 length:483 start_codon:yes stop_codon:yes gene_type:complete
VGRNKQSLIYFLISITVALLYNFLSMTGIPLIAKPLEKVTLEDDLTQTILTPQIRKIDIETAKKLHEQNVLFVDARAEEYLKEGFILGALANDDLGLLSQEIDDLIGFEKAFVIYCSDDDCGSSEDLAYSLQGYGFSNILVFQGGWKEWNDAGLPKEYHE